ncbi:hypothetical protein MRX96_036767 [Rhipicephalus microplus]
MRGPFEVHGAQPCRPGGRCLVPGLPRVIEQATQHARIASLFLESLTQKRPGGTSITMARAYAWDSEVGGGEGGVDESEAEKHLALHKVKTESRAARCAELMRGDDDDE